MMKSRLRRGALLWRMAVSTVLLSLAACGAKVELLAQASESQANEVLALLLNQGIAAEKQIGKEGVVAVLVPSNRVADAIDLMQKRGLPRTAHAGIGDVFRKDGMISSPVEERARMIYALSQELARTISHIDGVITAEVHVVLPERAALGDPGSPSSAAVFMKHQDTMPLSGVVPQVKRLVASSIPGLAYERVTVVLVPSMPEAAEESEPVVLAPGSFLGVEIASSALFPLMWRVVAACALALALGGAAAWWWQRRGR